MHLSCKRFLVSLLLAALMAVIAPSQQSSTPSKTTQPDLDFPTVLYGVVYYNEYMFGD